MPIRQSVLVACLLALVAALLALAVVPLKVAPVRAAPSVGTGSLPSGFPPDPFGVYFYPGANLVGADQMAEAGTRWALAFMDWSSIENDPGHPGTYDWSEMDAYLADAAAHGFQIVVTVMGNPAWTAASWCGPLYPEQMPALTQFLTTAVSRYSAPPYNVMHWALYNEPDNGDAINFVWLGGCWGRTHPNHASGAGGEAYANMLKQAYPAVKAGNPDALVLLGGLAYENWYNGESWSGPFDPNFLDELLAAGGGAYFDVTNFHYYVCWAGVWDTGDRYTSDIIGKANHIRNEVELVTGQDKPIMSTEIGRATSGPLSDNCTYNDELTSRYVVQGYARSYAAELPAVFWLEAVDEDWLQHKYGLLHTDLTPKPAYEAYKTLTKELAGAMFLTARRDFNTHVEGYDFDVGGRRKTVLWTTQEVTLPQSLQLYANGGSLRVVDKYGVEALIVDGSAADLDNRSGYVGFNIDASPRYVQDLSVLTPTPTGTPTVSLTPTTTPTASATPAPTLTPTPTATLTPTPTPTASATPAETVTPTASPTLPPTASATPAATVTPTATLTPTLTLTPTATPTVTPTMTSTPTASPTPTPEAPQRYDYIFPLFLRGSNWPRRS